MPVVAGAVDGKDAAADRADAIRPDDVIEDHGDDVAEKDGSVDADVESSDAVVDRAAAAADTQIAGFVHQTIAAGDGIGCWIEADKTVSCRIVMSNWPYKPALGDGTVSPSDRADVVRVLSVENAVDISQGDGT
ncbi:MAG TPA: hypothetical protein VH560_06415, partial [Polyangia bacterium]|nr:hypothetical protein [Polyangia bacterium]